MEKEMEMEKEKEEGAGAGAGDGEEGGASSIEMKNVHVLSYLVETSPCSLFSFLSF